MLGSLNEPVRGKGEYVLNVNVQLSSHFFSLVVNIFANQNIDVGRILAFITYSRIFFKLF